MAKDFINAINTVTLGTADGRAIRKDDYTEEERAEAMESMNTRGMKGVKLNRINMAFSKPNYEYLTTMARAHGWTYTEFVNHVLDEHREAHADMYGDILEFREKLLNGIK